MTRQVLACASAALCLALILALIHIMTLEQALQRCLVGNMSLV